MILISKAILLQYVCVCWKGRGREGRGGEKYTVVTLLSVHIL